MLWRDAVGVVALREGGREGTAALMAPTLALTALHVVADITSGQPVFGSGTISVTLGGDPIPATVDRYDVIGDWAILKLSKQPHVTPIALTSHVVNGQSWETKGFPDASEHGFVGKGQIRDTEHNLDGKGVRALQLFCNDAASGKGMAVRGLSGAPVIVDGAIAGVLRNALLEQDRCEAGTLFACPANTILERCLDLPVVDAHKLSQNSNLLSQRRQRISFWAIVIAICLALVVAAAMFYKHSLVGEFERTGAVAVPQQPLRKMKISDLASILTSHAQSGGIGPGSWVEVRGFAYSDDRSRPQESLELIPSKQLNTPLIRARTTKRLAGGELTGKNVIVIGRIAEADDDKNGPWELKNAIVIEEG